MDKEQLLKQETEKIIEAGRTRGSISEEDIMARLEHLGAGAEDLENVFNALAAENITVISAKEDDIDTIIEGNVDDSVKMYLKDIGKVPLLSAEEEVELAKRMEQGDETAKKVIHNWLEYVGCGIANVVNTFEPEVVCIGGGVSNQGEVLLAPVRAYVERETHNITTGRCPEIRACVLRNDAGVIGAAALANSI